MSFWEYMSEQWLDIGVMFIQHAEVVLIAIGIATVIAIALGILVEGHERLSRGVLSITGTMLTLPSFALFGLLIPILGLGLPPTIVTLVLYAIFPILRNTVTGLASVPNAVEDAARGMGLSPSARMRLVRLPMAWPVIITGIRVATVMTVAIAAIAAAVSGPGLGELIFSGLARIGGASALNEVLAGTIAVAILALAFDLLFVLIRRLTTSRGLI